MRKNWSVSSQKFVILFSLLSVIFLCIVVVYLYDYLHDLPIPYCNYLPETILAFAIGLSCSAYENRLLRRLSMCTLIAIVGFLFSDFIRTIMIGSVFVSSGLVCGFGETNYTRKIIFALKIIRSFFALVSLMAGIAIPLPWGGYVGTSFTEDPRTFLLVVFLPVVTLFLLDSFIIRFNRSYK